MAKELPYFQFEPAAYLSGNIQFCTYELQGVFINICALYWERLGEITKEQLERKFGIKLIDELILEKVIKIRKNKIEISFLDEQLIKRVELCKINSINGKLSAEARKQRKLNANDSSTTVKDSLNDSSTKSQPIEDSRGEKKKEEKIKEKKYSETSSVSFHSDFKNVFLEFYLEKTKSEYYWQAIDGAKVKSLTTKLLFKIKEKKPAIKKESEETEILKAFKYLLTNITDTWILSNLSMSIVDSKFNEIINKILNPSSNGKSDKQKAINDAEQLRYKPDIKINML